MDHYLGDVRPFCQNSFDNLSAGTPTGTPQQGDLLYVLIYEVP
jgi:hypothetical protein